MARWPFHSEKISFAARWRQVGAEYRWWDFWSCLGRAWALWRQCDVGLLAALSIAWWVFWTVPEDYG